MQARPWLRRGQPRPSKVVAGLGHVEVAHHALGVQLLLALERQAGIGLGCDGTGHGSLGGLKGGSIWRLVDDKHHLATPDALALAHPYLGYRTANLRAHLNALHALERGTVLFSITQRPGLTTRVL